MNVCGDTTLPQASSSDGEPTSPVSETSRHGTVESAFAVQMYRSDSQSGSDGSRFGCGKDFDVAEEHLVDGAAVSHARPYFLDVLESVKCFWWVGIGHCVMPKNKELMTAEIELIVQTLVRFSHRPAPRSSFPFSVISTIWIKFSRLEVWTLSRITPTA